MATLPTGGFARTSVLPQPGLVDPRLLAVDYSGIIRGAGEGLQLAGAYGQLRDQVDARRENARTRAQRIAAQNARNQYLTEKSQSDLGSIAAEDSVRRKGLQLEDKSLDRQIELEPMASDLARKKLSLAQGEAAFEINRQPVAQQLQETGDILKAQGQELEKTQNNLSRQAQEIDAIQNSAQKAIADETAEFVRSNPGATTEKLQAQLAQSKRLKAQSEKLEKFIDENPEYDTQKFRTDLAQSIAAEVQANYIVKQGGAPTPRRVSEKTKFSEQAAVNLANADKYLGLGSLELVEAFQKTPRGKKVVSDVSQYSGNRPITPEAAREAQQAVNEFLESVNRESSPPTTIPSDINTSENKNANFPIPSTSAINYLRKNPDSKVFFERTYGVSADNYLK
jgi:hypothetical protein